MNNKNHFKDQPEDITSKYSVIYKALIENAEDGFFVHDFQGRFLDVNQGACRSLGYSRGELLNMSVSDIEEGLELAEIQKFWARCRPGYPLRIHGRHRRKNGSDFPIEVQFGCFIYKEEKIFFSLVRDISDKVLAQELLKQSEMKFRRIVEGSPDPILIQRDFGMPYLNPAACRLFKVRLAEQMSGYHILDFVHHEYRTAFGQIIMQLQHQENPEQPHLEIKMISSKGNEIWVEMKGEYVEYDGQDSTLLFLRDITQRRESEQQLRQTQAQLQAAINNMTDAVYISDTQGRFDLINEAFATFHRFGSKEECSKTQLELHTILEKYYPDGTLVPHDQWSVPRALRGETASNDEFILKRHDTGQTWDGSYSFSPIRDEKGNITSAIVVARDITEQKQAQRELQEQERLLNLVVQNLPVGLMIANHEGHIILANKEIERIWAGSPKVGPDQYEEYKGWWSKTGQRIRKNDWALARALQRGEESHNEEIFIECFDGTCKTILNTAIPILDENNQITGAIALNQDITLSKRAEEAIKKAEIATESAKFKQNFLANMSHEIRTPLTGVMGMISMLQQTNPTDVQREYISILKSSGETLREIINQILDLSKIEAGKTSLNYTVFEFAALLNNARKLFQGMRKENVSLSMELDPRIPKHIEADMSRMSQVMNNLVSNAVKFTVAGEIKIIAQLESKLPGGKEIMIRIMIRDTGIGIPPQMQKKLFTPFFQVGDGSTSPGSTGLGLAISRELVNLHGGQMGVESEPQKGSTFWFTFVARKVPKKLAEKVPLQPEAADAKDHLSILLVEDNRVNQKVFEVILRHMGHEVTIASDGQQALDKFDPQAFHLILMDINMPVMDGIAATRALKETYPSPPPIVGLSANAVEGDREKYIALGMDDYLTKPLIEEEFNEVIRKLFGQ